MDQCVCFLDRRENLLFKYKPLLRSFKVPVPVTASFAGESKHNIDATRGSFKGETIPGISWLNKLQIIWNL